MAIAAFVAASCSNKYRERNRRQADKAESSKEKALDTAAYRQAADYVIADYIKAYIDKKTNSAYKENQHKNEWNILKSNSFEKPISAEQLEQIIEKTPVKIEELSKEGVTNFYDEIKDKRENYSKEWTKEELIENLVELPDKYQDWFTKGFKKYPFDSLRSELSRRLPEANESKEAPPLPAGKAQKDSSSESSGISWWRWFFVAFAALGIAFAVRRRQRQKKTAHSPAVKAIRLDIKDFETVFKWILNNPDKLYLFSTKILKNKQLCRLWIESCLKYPEITNLLKAELPKREESTAASTPVNSADAGAKRKIGQPGEAKKPETVGQPAAFTASPRYADAISGDFFNKVCEQPNEDTVFELNLRTLDLATFTVYREAYSRVIKRPEFLSGCDKQVLPNGHTIKIERQGEAQRQVTGKWRIVKKLNVIVE